MYVIVYMKNQSYKRTTIWIPKELHTQVKIFSALAGISFSEFVRFSLMDKIKKVKEETNKARNI